MGLEVIHRSTHSIELASNTPMQCRAGYCRHPMRCVPSRRAHSKVCTRATMRCNNANRGRWWSENIRKKKARRNVREGEAVRPRGDRKRERRSDRRIKGGRGVRIGPSKVLRDAVNTLIATYFGVTPKPVEINFET